MKQSLTEAGAAYLAAREAYAIAEAAKAEADRILKEMLTEAGADHVVVGEEKVVLTPMPGDKYDADTLRDLVSPAVFKKVTKVTVDNAKLKAAIKIGTITADTAEAANVGKPFTQLRVYDAKGEAELPVAKPKKTKKVA